MNTSKIKSEQIVLGVKESNEFNPSFVIEIQNDSVKQFIKDNDGLYHMVIFPEKEMIPFEIRSIEPVDVINIKIHINEGYNNSVEYDVEINWFDILKENNKSYIHKSCLIPSTMKGTLMISPLIVTKISFKSGRILEKDADCKMIISY